MPSRILRDSISTSDSVALLPEDVQDRLPWYFLAADDYGCFLVQPDVIKGRVFPRRIGMKPQRVSADLGELAKAGIIRTWQADGKTYAVFPKWFTHQRQARSGAKRKTPAPPPETMQAVPTAAEPRAPAADAQEPAAEPQAPPAEPREPAESRSDPQRVNANPPSQSQSQVKQRTPIPPSAEPPAETKLSQAVLSVGPTDAEQVFEHWRRAMGKNARTDFDKKRRRAVEKQLVAGKTVLDLQRAIDGCRATPHNMGANEQRQRYDDLRLICRNAANVERFMGSADRPCVVLGPDGLAIQATVTQLGGRADSPVSNAMSATRTDELLSREEAHDQQVARERAARGKTTGAAL